MTYKDIQGWFDFEDVYTEMVLNAPKDAVFVELGSWLGKSTAFMAYLIKEKRPDIKFYAVDVWDYIPEDQFYKDLISKLGDIQKVFNNNMRACGVAEFVTPIRKSTLLAAKDFEDGSIDFGFIDANHNYPYVLYDIQAWLPKIKKGGFIGGHDHTDSPHHAGVVRAVKESFNDYKIIGSSWLVQK